MWVYITLKFLPFLTDLWPDVISEGIYMWMQSNQIEKKNQTEKYGNSSLTTAELCQLESEKIHKVLKC